MNQDPRWQVTWKGVVYVSGIHHSSLDVSYHFECVWLVTAIRKAISIYYADDNNYHIRIKHL